HQLDGLLAVGLVDAHGPGGADAVRLQEDEDVAHRLLLAPALADALHAAGADSLDLLQKGGALVDDLQGARAEDLDDLAGEVRADALDEAGAEVAGDALGGVRRRGAQLVGPELQAVVAVLRPGARGLDVLAGHGTGQVTDHRHQAAAAGRLHAQY